MHQYSLSRRIILLSISMSLSSCADDPHAPGEALESEGPELVSASMPEVELTTQALETSGFLLQTRQSNAEIFRWRANSRDVVMRPVATHLCALTEVKGHLDDSSAVAVHRNLGDINLGDGVRYNQVTNDASPNWKLSGWHFNTSNSLIAGGTCAPLADFKVEPGGVKRISTRGWALVNPSRPGCGGTQTTEMWKGATTFISSVRGDFEGGGESVEIINSEYSDIPDLLRVKTGQCHQHEGIAYSFFANVPGEWGVNGAGGASLAATEDHNRKKRLSPTKTSFCFLTRVSGDFNGAEERLRIYPQVDADGKEYWWFEANAGDGSAYGSAKCIYYDQRWPVVL